MACKIIDKHFRKCKEKTVGEEIDLTLGGCFLFLSALFLINLFRIYTTRLSKKLRCVIPN